MNFFIAFISSIGLLIIYWIYSYRKNRHINDIISSKTEVEDILDNVSMYVKGYEITEYEYDNLNRIFFNDNLIIGNYWVKAFRCIDPLLFYMAISYDDSIPLTRFPSRNFNFKESNDFLLKINKEKNLLEVYTDSTCATNEKTFLIKDIANEIAKYIKTRM